MFQILRIYVCKPAIYCAVVVDSQNNWTIMVFLEYRAWLSSFSKVIKGNERQEQLIGSKVFSNVTEGVSGTKWAPTYFQGYPSLNQNWHAKCLLRKLSTKVWEGALLGYGNGQNVARNLLPPDEVTRKCPKTLNPVFKPSSSRVVIWKKVPTYISVMSPNRKASMIWRKRGSFHRFIWSIKIALYKP